MSNKYCFRFAHSASAAPCSGLSQAPGLLLFQATLLDRSHALPPAHLPTRQLPRTIRSQSLTTHIVRMFRSHFSGPTAIQLWQHGAGTGSSVGRGTRATFLQHFAIKKQQFAIFVQQLAAFCIILHHVATLCCILQQFATICNILQQFATVCSILQHFASLLQHLATTLQPFAAFGSILQPFGSGSVVFS